MLPPHTAGALQILGPRAHRRRPTHAQPRTRDPVLRSPNPALPNRHARNPRAHRHSRAPTLGGALSRRREEPPPKRSPPNPPRLRTSQLRNRHSAGPVPQHAELVPAAVDATHAGADPAGRRDEHAASADGRRNDGRVQRCAVAVEAAGAAARAGAGGHEGGGAADADVSLAEEEWRGGY